MRPTSIALLWFALALPVAASDTVALSPANLVLNAYLSLKLELEAPRQDIESAVARSQSRFWDYEHATRSAFGEEWAGIEASEHKWAMISAVGGYLHAALSRLMGSAHAPASVTVTHERVEEETGQAVVSADIRLLSGERPVEVFFRLHRSPHGWRIYDFSAPGAGFQLSTNIRSNTLPTLQTEGLERTISHLQHLSEAP